MKTLAALALAFSLLLVGGGFSARASDDFQVEEVWFESSADGHALRARLQPGAAEAIRQLLGSGYLVRLKFDLRLMRARKWLPDSELGVVEWQPQLSFDTLLNRYTFQAGGESDEFDNLEAALERVAALRAAADNSPSLAEILSAPDTYFLARYEMLVDHLPQPLQVSLLTGKWEIDSGWRRLPAKTLP